MIVGFWAKRLAPRAFRAVIRAAILAALLLGAVTSPLNAALINPLAYPSLGSFEVGIGNGVVIDTTLREIRVNGILAFTGTVDNQSGAADAAAGIPELAVFSFDQIAIGPGVAVTVVGERGLALLSRNDVTLRSAISVSGGDFASTSPAGGFAGGGTVNHGTGPGNGFATTIGNYAGAGGGGYGGAGGQGGGYSAADSLGGASYPVSNSLVGPLYGGSGGGAGRNGDTFGAGGGGGGVLEISALGDVHVFAPVTSNGGAAGVAANGYGGGGGGSGGSIRVAGAHVQVGLAGVISANGSAGGMAFGGDGTNAGGGGGGGRVLVQQSASPLATGVTASGGAATGAGKVGANGTVEQLQSYLETNSAELYVRLGTGSATGQAALARGGNTTGSVFGWIDEVGAGFSGAAVGQEFAFSGPLGGSIVQLVPLTYATNSRGTQQITVRSNGGDAVLATGRGVGPTLATNMGIHPDTMINLGLTGVNHSAAFHLIVSNASTDLGSDSPLTALGILDVSITGPDAAAFAVDDLIPTTLFEQQHANLPIHFHPTESRIYQATLTIRTDQGAASGTEGQSFSYQLIGGGAIAVPEPTTMAFCVGAMGLSLIGRRRI